MRPLKHHEKKLLKKVDFLQWKREHNIREVKVLARFLIADREDYSKYNKLAGIATKLVALLKELKPDDPFRQKITDQLLDKLYQFGAIPTRTSLAVIEKLSTSSFAKRRLPVIMVRNKMATSMKEAVTFVEQGHVRVGPEVVSDPAYIVTRSMEDFVTWVDSSKIKRTVATYNDALDDYDLLGN